MPTPPPASRPGDDPAFAQAWARADRIGGWLTEAQGRLLWDSALDRPPGPAEQVVEVRAGSVVEVAPTSMRVYASHRHLRHS